MFPKGHELRLVDGLVEEEHRRRPVRVLKPLERWLAEGECVRSIASDTSRRDARCLPIGSEGQLERFGEGVFPSDEVEKESWTLQRNSSGSHGSVVKSIMKSSRLEKTVRCSEPSISSMAPSGVSASRDSAGSAKTKAFP